MHLSLYMVVNAMFIKTEYDWFIADHSFNSDARLLKKIKTYYPLIYKNSLSYQGVKMMSLREVFSNAISW